MNEEKDKLNVIDTVDEETQASHDGKRRISWVSKDLRSMIDFIGKVYNKLGHTEYLSNKAIAAVHELSPDSIKMQLSSAQQYRMLELKHRIGYKISEHFQKLYLPKSDVEKRAAVIESLKLPETYQQLFKDYEYHTVPQDGVKNHFIRTFGMKDDVATKAASVFIDNLKDFGLLDSRGVLISALTPKPVVQELSPDGEEEGENSKEHLNGTETSQQHQTPARRGDKLIFQSEIDRAGKKTVPIYLIDNKQAMFVYPDDITEDDIELVKHQIDGILLKIKLESRRKEKDTSARESRETEVE